MTATFASKVRSHGGFSTNDFVATTYGLTINGTVIYRRQQRRSAVTLTGQDVVNQINMFTGSTGVTASLTTTGTTGELVLTNTDGSNINAVQTYAAGTAGTGGATAGVAASGGTAPPRLPRTGGVTSYGQVTLTDADPVTIAGQRCGRRIGGLGLHLRQCDDSGHGLTVPTRTFSRLPVPTAPSPRWIRPWRRSGPSRASWAPFRTASPRRSAT